MSELIDRIFDVERIEKDKKAVEAILESLSKSIEAQKDVISGILSNTRKAKSTDDLVKGANDLNDAYSKGKKTIDLYTETQKQLENQEKLLIQTKSKLATANTGNAKAIDSSKRALKDQNDLLKAENILNDKNAGSLEKAAAENLKLGIEKRKLNLATDEGKKRLEEINAAQDKNNKLIADSGNKLEKQKINIGNYKSHWDGLFDSFKSGEIGVGGLTKGVMSLGKQMMIAIVTNPVLLTVSAIVGAFMLLKNAITRNEEGQDRLNKVTAIFSAALDAVMDMVNAVAIMLFDAFSKPKESIEKLGTLIKENIFNRFEALGKILPKIGELFLDLKNLNFAELKKDAKDLAQEWGAVITGLSPEQQNNIAKGLGKIGDKILENANKGATAAKLQADYNKLERKYIVENAELTAISAKKRADAEELKKTNAKAALKLLEQAADADEKIAANELRLAKMRNTLAKKQSDIAIDNIADKKALADAEADVFAKQSAYDEKRRERLRNANKIGKEALAQQLEQNKYIIESMTAEANASIKKNDIIASDEKESLDNRLKAVEDNNKTRLNIINESYSMDKKTLTDNLAIKFISQEDYDSAMIELDKKHKSELEEQETEHQNNIKITTDDAQKTQIEAFQKEAERKAEIAANAYAKEEDEAKKQYLKILNDSSKTDDEREQAKKDLEKNLNKIQLNALKEGNDIIAAGLEKQLENFKGTDDEKLALSNKLAALRIANENAVTDAAIKAGEDQIAADKAAYEKRMSITQELMGATQEVFGAIADYSKQQSEAKIADLEAEQAASDERFAKEQEQLDGAIMSDEARAAKQKEINDKKAAADKAIQDKIKAEKIKQAKWDKAQALISAISQTALAVMKVFAQTGIFGFITAGLVAAAGAIQVATIASQPIPAFAEGGITKGGEVLWGEKQTEIAVTPSGKTFIADSPTVSTFDAGTRIYKSVSDYEKAMSLKGDNSGFSFDYQKMADAMPRNSYELNGNGSWTMIDKQNNRRTVINRRCNLS